ncbi:hypothetical protein G3H63_09155 [Microbacterium resistens]|uniref:phage minor capsid protein n=1 Tax=Microbacterium resistens TaxID=156977 RepID=UPI001C584D6C|nr:phage minor capsid protein [Microbacterium resistens]MBW1639238.1 hypothetical protein [Microbacterium resistens]
MAGFSPEHEDFQALVDRIAAQVAGTFANAESRLLAEIARRLARDLPELPTLAEQLALVRELETLADALTRTISRDLAEEIIARATAEGAASVVGLPSLGPVPAIAEQHAIAAALVAWDLGNAFADMRARILRYPRDAMGQFLVGGDVYQQVIANQVGQVPLGATITAARKAALQEFLARGVTGFTDVAGRNWRIGTYAEMATRTAVARAYLDAKVYRAGQVGIDLFTVLGGNNACAHCAPWFGKILATSGPTGPRVVPHSFEDGTVVVNVAGTLADWRASGAGHPNCTCVPVEYLPGFTVPMSAPGYDPAAHAARDRLRELEVRERDAKRRLEIAMAADDQDRVNRYQRRILDLQRQTREHVAATGQRRRYDRAQPRFADGRQDGDYWDARRASLGQPPSGDRSTAAGRAYWDARQRVLAEQYRLSFGPEKIEPQEIRFYERFLADGHRVSIIRRPENAPPIGDFVWHRPDGAIPVELKSIMREISEKHLYRPIRSSIRQYPAREYFLIDLGDVAVSPDVLRILGAYNTHPDNRGAPARRLFVFGAGELVEIDLT